MSIVATEVESVHGALGGQRIIFYRFQDSTGAWHSSGPVVTFDDNFDIAAFGVRLAASKEVELAEAEFAQLIS